MNATATHLPVICRSFIELINSNGNVLELGMGDYSTPILHELCFNRKLVSIESSKGWYSKFINYVTEKHEIKLITDWDNLPEYEQDWDIVFVDQAPAKDRMISIKALGNKSKIIIVHDTEIKSTYVYKYDLSLFKYKSEYKRFEVETTVVSNFIDVSEWWKNPKYIWKNEI